MTYLMPSMVTDASATLVLMMTLRDRGGAGSKTAICSSVERPEWRGSALRSGAPFGRLQVELSDQLTLKSNVCQDAPNHVVCDLL